MSLFLETLKELNVWSVTLRVAMAVLFGGLIGLERGYHGRAAGLRTHILVCLGAAMTVMVGIYSVTELGLTGDPMRIGAQVVSGIGFLGAGTIMIRNRDQITGLTTAAGLWATACIGLVIGIGFYVAAILAFLSVIVTISVMIYLERSIKSKSVYRCYLELSDVGDFRTIYREIEPFAVKTEVIPAKSGISHHVGVEIKTDTKEQYESLIAAVAQNTAVVIALPIRN